MRYSSKSKALALHSFLTRERSTTLSACILAFFNLGRKQTYSLIENNIGEVNTRPVYNNSQPFLPEYVDATNAADVFHYVGKKVSKCCDNRLRLCKVFYAWI